MRSRYVFILASVASLLLLYLSPSAIAQKAPVKKKVDSEYITDDFFAALVIHPSRLEKSPAWSTLKLDRFASLMKAKLGVEPKQIEQVTFLFPSNLQGLFPVARTVDVDHLHFPFDGPFPGEAIPVARAPRPFPFAVVFHLSEPLAGKDLADRFSAAAGFGELQEAVHDGKTYWKSTRRILAAIYAPDRRTLVVANEKNLRAMIASKKKKSRLAELASKADAAADVSLLLAPAGLRKELVELRKAFRNSRFGDGEAFMLGVILQMADRIESVSLSVSLFEEPRLSLEVTALSAEAAETLNDLARGWHAISKLVLPEMDEMFNSQIAQYQTRFEERFYGAGMSRMIQQMQIVQLVFRAIELTVSDMKISRDGNRILARADLKESNAEIVHTIAQAIAIGSGGPPPAASLDNLRELAKGMLEFEKIHKVLPPHASYEGKPKSDKEAKPLLSWRVHILPFIKQYDLWRKFHHDEPWDSPHNKKLIVKMPPVFNSPGRFLGEGKTRYVVPLGGGKKYATIFPPGATAGNRGGALPDGYPVVPKGLTLQALVDGRINTVMIVELPAEKAVIWTKPVDWVVDAKKLKQGLFGLRASALASLADGSVHRLSSAASVETLLRALGRADGDTFDRAKVFTPAKSRRKGDKKRTERPVFDDAPPKQEER